MSDTTAAILAELAEASAQRKKRAAIVGAELRILRRERMLEADNKLAMVAARAYNAGAKMVDIKLALGTTDHGTARNAIEVGEILLNALTPQVEAAAQDEAEAEEESWFEVDATSGTVTIRGVKFEVYSMEFGSDETGAMLTTEAPLYPNGYEEPADTTVREYDGFGFPADVKTAEHREIESALRRGGIL